MVDVVRPCVVIPTYDNPRTIGDVVARVRAHVPEVIVVDDGSGPAAREVLATLASAGAITLVTRARNGGKGAAVLDGLHAARAAGFTHAIQVDADGQHDTDDVPKLLAAAIAQPTALVLAAP
ncbi:MAG: glycosyltransferase family 2 protein, partial [Myxococcales bacterium]|nr:glycosyltransferase family 2 protein [Myxococcales bacterium]